MKKSIIISQEIRDLDALLFKANKLKKEYPNDFAISLTIENYSARKIALLNELEIAFKEDNCHIMDVAIQRDNFPSIEMLSDIFSAIKNGFDAVADILSIKVGVSHSFAATYNGSFGIRMVTTPDDSIVLGDTLKSMEKFYAINLNLKIPAANVLEEFKGNKKALRKFSKYYKAISKQTDSIKFRWGKIHGDDDNFEISPAEAGENYIKLLLADTAEYTEEEIDGIIKEINLLTRTFIIVSQDKNAKIRNTTIKFKEEEKDDIAKRLDAMCSVKYSHERKYNYEDEKIDDERILLSIETV